tara:strand:+ start:78 stop:689 length:612 start_codon:yes stop_codon:yes gene_type:complete
MPISINGSGSITGLSVGGLPDGSVALADLATTGTASSSTFLRGDGAFAAAGGGIFDSYAVIADVKSSGTAGGTFSTGNWRTRDLNTEIVDTDGIVSISSNQFTLQAGSYLINAISSAYKIHNTVLKLYNITDSSDTAFGMTGYIPNTTSNQTNIHLTTRFTISGAKVFELQQAGAGTENTYGMGVNHSFGSEIYTIIEIYKES